MRDEFLWKCINFHADNPKAFKLKKLWKYVELKYEKNTESEFEELKAELVRIMED